MKITIEFTTDNAAFEDNPFEVDELIQAACYIAQKEIAGMNIHGLNLRDTNGNTVGRVEVSEQ